MTRNTRWPARIEYCGSIVRADGLGDAEHDAATRVPHSEPSPPMTTASKAKMSWVGPLDGSKVERMARKAPASVAVPTAIAVARA